MLRPRYNLRGSARRKSTRAHFRKSVGLALLMTICLAFYLVRIPTRPSKEHHTPEISAPSVTIPVPARPLKPGERVTSRDFFYTQALRPILPQEFVRSINERARYVVQAPLTLASPIPISALRLESSETSGVVTQIPQGMRAITVRVDAESAVEGWARPGDSVDVILVRSSKDGSSGLESLVIAENVKILSAGSSTAMLATSDTAPTPPNTTTLLVTQNDALRIKIAASIGKLTFALRGHGDEAPTLIRLIDQKRALPSTTSRASTKQSLSGKARGPDGKVYLLPKDSEWIRAAGSLERDESVGAISTTQQVKVEGSDEQRNAGITSSN